MNPFVNLLKWYFRRAALPFWFMLLIDSLTVVVSGVLIYYIFHPGIELLRCFSALLRTMVIYVVFSLLSFRIFRIYAGVVRYSSFIDLQRVAVANFLAMLLAIGLCYVTEDVLLTKFVQFSVLQTVAIYVVATGLMWGLRILVKILYDVATSDKRAIRVFVYGATGSSVGLAKNIRAQKPTRFLLKGFITNDPQYHHNLIMGERVYSAMDNLPAIIKKRKIEAVLVSPLQMDEFRNKQDLQDVLINSGVKIFITKMEQQWDGSDNLQDSVLMQEVSVEDLLPRDEIKIDMASVARELAGKRILITGAAGSIGSEMVKQVAAFRPAAMVLIDQAETPEHDLRLMLKRLFPDTACQTVVTSICKEDRMEKIFSDFRPEYVFHAAAYKHVPMMEDNPSEAVQNNVYGTKVIADLSVKYGVKKFVMVSTDKAVNPTNVMGCSKRICEIYVQSLNRSLEQDGQATHTQFVTTRFGNVLGSNGSVIPLFREQIKRGGPVTVTHPDIIRYFMLISEACKLVLEAGVKGNGGEIFVFDMGKPVKIADLARRMIQLSGAMKVEVKFTGLRPGEKLYEEVLNKLEGNKPSFNEKICIAQVREYDFCEVSEAIDQLIETSKNYDDQATVRKMMEIVPEYHSENSFYGGSDVKK